MAPSKTNIDFEKAFDTIEWNFIERTFKRFNFPKQLIKWINTFYTDIETCIINNGSTTKFFKPERGVRQGCPLSPYLFTVAVEMLSMVIKQDINIKGINGENENQYTISQFADEGGGCRWVV